jgi:Mg/Co/Ni transporter MgtE
MASIAIDTNMYLIKNKLSITSERMANYANKTVDEIIEAEKAQGNTKAAELEKQLQSDPQTLIKTYQLDNPGNKFNILQQVPEQKRPEMLELLEDDDLRMGLNFFSQEQLLKLVEDYAPIEEVVNAALISFPLQEVMEMMPDKELNNFIVNKDLDEEFLKKHLSNMDPAVLASMIETATGEPVFEEDPKKLMTMLTGLDDDAYQEALIAMNSDAKRVMVMNMYQQDQEVLQLFPADAYTDMLATLEKEEMMPSMQAMTTDTLIGMDSELPPELMSIVLTQIDPKDFAKELIQKYPNLLTQIVAS